MTDVRLTATTPEGEVVPALANTKGELLLEAPIAPPEFDGNLDGDLTVTGSAAFAASLDIGSAYLASGSDSFNTYLNAALGSDYFIASKAPGDLSTSPILFGVKTDGAASFKGTISTDKNIAAAGNASIEGNIVAGHGNGSTSCKLGSDGTASFAGVKAGFTAEGELIFTSRNVRYKLVVQDNLVFPEPYTPVMQLEEKLERAKEEKLEQAKEPRSESDNSY